MLERRPYRPRTALRRDRAMRATHCGRVRIGKRKNNLSHVFARQQVGIREIAENICLVSFMH